MTHLPADAGLVTHLSVRALIRDAAGRLLFLRRSRANARFADTWEFPGGKVDHLEALEAALQREVREETGLQVEVGSLCSFAEKDISGLRMLCLLFEARVAGGELALSDEHDACVWETCAGAASLALNSFTVDLLRNRLAAPLPRNPSKPLAVSLKALIRNADGAVLALQRSPASKGNPGRWDFPGGKADPDEGLDEALVREIREETGLAVRLERVVGCAQSESPKTHVVYIFLDAVLTAGEVRLSEEHHAAQWVAPAAFAALDVCPQFASFLASHFGADPTTDAAGKPEAAPPVLVTTTGPDGASVTSVNPAWHRGQIEAYQAEFPVYKTYAGVLEQVLKGACSLYAPLGIVQVRPKSLSSFAEKAVRKAHKYADPVRQLTDLCGARVICQTDEEVLRIRDFIRAHFRVDEANSEDTVVRLRQTEFGYRSIHFVVQMDRDEVLGQPTHRAALGVRKAEIQVRTILQHAWSDILHDRLYKGAIRPTALHVREASTIAALLEKADASFGGLAGDLDAYTTDFASHLTPEQLAAEIRALDLVLANEPRPEARPAQALRLARLCRQAGEPRRATELLRRHPVPVEHPLAPELALCLGETLLSEGDGLSDPAERAAGVRELERLLDGGDLARQAAARGVTDHRFTHLASRAAHALALAMERDPDREREARHYHQRALQLCPDHPYHLLDRVTFEITATRNWDSIELIRLQLAAAAETCRRHVAAGVEVLRARLALGRCLLLLDRADESLQEYLGALSMCLDQPRAAGLEAVGRERAALTRLNRLREIPPAYQRTLDLLLIAGALGRPEETASLLAPRAKHRFGGGGPVLVVAGSCDGMRLAFADRMRATLAPALRGFVGTVIGGGTTAGAAGVCGDLLTAAPATPLIGYVPARLSEGAALHPRYAEQVRTSGDHFGMEQVIQYWIDILASGLRPGRVTVLGLDGGAIARMEYLLALVLGARVLWLGDTGEASPVPDTLTPAEQARFIPLPADACTAEQCLRGAIRSFEPAAEEALARRIHERFLASGRYPHPDPALRPWDDLREDLKDSNRSQVVSLVQALGRRGLQPAPAGDPRPAVALAADDIEVLAEMEHGRWNAERLAAGWRWGAVRDPAGRRSPYLQAWTDLPEPIREYDRENVRAWPGLLQEAGLKMVRVRPPAAAAGE